MKRTLILAMLMGLAQGGCAKGFPGMSRHAATSRKPTPTATSPANSTAQHVATKVIGSTASKPESLPAAAPAKAAGTHKS